MNNETTLPCGCRLWQDVIDGETTLIFEPHDVHCENYAYFLAESERQGKSPTAIDLR
jgi:hypothetical protein